MTKNSIIIEEPSLEIIIKRIDERLAALNLSDRQASLRATGYPDAIREIRRFKRPSSKRLVQLAAALETTPDWLGGYVDHALGKVWLESTQSALPINGVAGLPRDIPVYGPTIEQEVGPVFTETVVEEGRSVTRKYENMAFAVGYNFDEPIDHARRPPRIALREDVYCILVQDDGLYPRFEIADIVYVDPRSRPAVGEYAAIRLTSEAVPGFFTGGVWTILVQIKNDSMLLHPYELAIFKPAIQFTLERSVITDIHRIIPWSELLSL